MKKQTVIRAVLIAAGVSLLASGPAFAQASGGGINIEGVLQNIVTMLTGNVARLLAIIAVILAGIATMFGRLDMSKFGILVVGMGLVFGAAQIVSMVTGA